MAKRTKLYKDLTTHRRETDILMKGVEIQNLIEDAMAEVNEPLSAVQLDALETLLNISDTNDSFNIAKTEFQNPTP